MVSKQRPPTPVRFSAEEELAVVKRAAHEGMKKSSWIKKLVRRELKKPIKRINERSDQEKCL